MGSTKGTTKSGGQKHSLDKFYTKPEIAQLYIDKCDLTNYSTVIEPSAGSGAFSNHIESCIAMDLAPENDGIIEQDWFTYIHTKKENEKILVIGNPPFGQQNSLAVRFINHAAKFADRVAFILPISFKKESLHNRIDLKMHLVYEEEIPKDSFILNGDNYDVKCVFQIWDKKDILRVKMNQSDLNSNNLFDYVQKSDSPDGVIQRIGGNAGKASPSWSEKSQNSNYFIKLKEPTNDLSSIIDALNKISYPSRNYSVGPRSISKREMNEEINKIFPL